MDGHRFDQISRLLANGSSRRTTVRALAAGAFAAGLGRLGLEEAAAKCAKIGKKCKTKHGKKKCCGGATCQGKKCKCPGGTENSGGVCGTRPTCGGFEHACTGQGDECCSGSCVGALGCDRAAPGKPCYEDNDCFMTDICVGFVCQG